MTTKIHSEPATVRRKLRLRRVCGVVLVVSILFEDPVVERCRETDQDFRNNVALPADVTVMTRIHATTCWWRLMGTNGPTTYGQ